MVSIELVPHQPRRIGPTRSYVAFNEYLPFDDTILVCLRLRKWGGGVEILLLETNFDSSSFLPRPNPMLIFHYCQASPLIDFKFLFLNSSFFFLSILKNLRMGLNSHTRKEEGL